MAANLDEIKPEALTGDLAEPVRVAVADVCRIVMVGLLEKT